MMKHRDLGPYHPSKHIVTSSIVKLLTKKKKKKQNTKIKYEVGRVFEEKEGKPGVLSNYFSILVTSYPHHYHYHMHPKTSFRF